MAVVAVVAVVVVDDDVKWGLSAFDLSFYMSPKQSNE
jgi:hypothetical protein